MTRTADGGWSNGSGLTRLKPCRNQGYLCMNTDLLLRYATRMPSLPKLVQEIIQAFNQPNVDADLIAGKVMLDQVLTAKILRLANSSFYGGRRSIESANDAVVLLGFDALRNLVIASAVAGAFQNVAGHIDFTAFWRKSYMVAALAKWLVRRCGARGPTPDTAFTAGLLHEIGSLAAACAGAAAGCPGGSRGQARSAARGV
ncbi:MAG: HDOD domain-containing protein [Gammaproteobacteria bacterium]|nr:HDOD domain-containing protein [Gammaproteobacteria bacterium]